MALGHYNEWGRPSFSPEVAIIKSGKCPSSPFSVYLSPYFPHTTFLKRILILCHSSSPCGNILGCPSTSFSAATSLLEPLHHLMVCDWPLVPHLRTHSCRFFHELPVHALCPCSHHTASFPVWLQAFFTKLFLGLGLEPRWD